MKKVAFSVITTILIIVGIVLVMIFFRPSLIISKEEVKTALQSPHSHFLKWKNAEIHYTDEGNGIPMLMIHGFGGAYTHFDAMAALMKDKYRVIRVDLPGFGLSDMPAAYPTDDFRESYQDYIQFLIDTLSLDSLYVIGNSLGGMIAWNTAADHSDKVKKLVLLSPAGYELEQTLAPGNIFRNPLAKQFALRGQFKFMTRSGLEKAFYKKDKVDDELVNKIYMFTNRDGVIPHMLNIALSKNFPDTNKMKNVQCPTLIIWGKEDVVIPVQHAALFEKDIPDSKVVIFENSGHCPMIEDPEMTTDECLRFFEN